MSGPLPLTHNKQSRWLPWILTAYLLGITLLGYQFQRSSPAMLLTYALVFLLYLGVLNFRLSHFKLLLLTAIMARMLLLFSEPSLSDDYLRFLWDGNLSLRGISPYALKPSMVTGIDVDHSIEALVQSKNYYSVYPPITQYLFWLVVATGRNILVQIVVLRILVIAFEMGSIWLILQLLDRFNIHRSISLVYALNPLIIMELTGNLHMEVVMIFFLLLTVWLLEKHKWVMSAFALGAAIATKLIPLLLLLFFIPRLGLRRWLAFTSIACGVTILLFLPFNIHFYFAHILESLRLYAVSFEFNGSIYYLVRSIGYSLSGYNHIKTIGPVLGMVSLAGIGLVALRNSRSDTRSIINAALIGFTIYFLFATTVMPWYITTLVALGIFTRFTFPIVWSGLIILTYYTYTLPGWREPAWILLLEYGVLYVVLGFELFRNTSLIRFFIRWTIKVRAQIKVKRIEPFLKEGESLLDIGMGNGGVAKCLRGKGHAITGLDIRDKSFFPDTHPVIYDGAQMPFDNNQFDTALLLTMLHHTPDPAHILAQAKKVSSGRLVVMEDVYTSAFQRKITWLADSLVNWEWATHPHTNHTEKEWETIFQELHLKIEGKQSARFLWLFHQTTWVLRV